MKIRGACEDDIAALAGVAERSYRSFAGILEDEVLAERDEAFFAMRLEARRESLTLAEDGAHLLGFLLMTDRHIDMLFVDPACSGKGAGSELLGYAERKGARSLECFRENHRARAFYERRGWRLQREYDREFAGKHRSFVFYAKG